MIGDYIFFSGYLEKGERLLFVAHRHFLFLFSDALKWLLLGVIFPFGVWFFWSQTFLFCAVWSGIFSLWFLFRAADWYFDAWLLTDAGVVDLEWNGVWHRLSTRVSYSEINSISGEIRGFWGTIFRFGLVRIGLASGNDLFLDGVFRPQKVESEILKRQEAAKSRDHSKRMEEAHDVLGEIIAFHLENRR